MELGNEGARPPVPRKDAHVMRGAEDLAALLAMGAKVYFELQMGIGTQQALVFDIGEKLWMDGDESEALRASSCCGRET